MGQVPTNDENRDRLTCSLKRECI
ncbi:hypothetical protein MIMGU_mgv1a0143092mg, partial [Erythranthe guttata]